jgi:CheY-like chemotaxis protein
VRQGSLAELRVVVAEDNTLVRDLLVTFLTENGAKVFPALDGRAALAAVQANQPDILLLDIALPELDGIEVATTLRRSGERALRIIGLSAHASAADELRARAAGMDEFFTKPVSLSRLMETLARHKRREARGIGAAANHLDERLRLKLAADFAQETPRLIEEMYAALAQHDWLRLRSRAHYLKNSADIIGDRPLQDACRSLESFDAALSPAFVRQLVEAVANAVPEKAFALADTPAADRR